MCVPVVVAPTKAAGECVAWSVAEPIALGCTDA